MIWSLKWTFSFPRFRKRYPGWYVSDQLSVPGVKFSDIELGLEARTMFVNYWDIKLEAKAFPTEQNDYYESRTTNRVYKRPESLQIKMEGSTDFRKRLAIRLEFASDMAGDERSGNSYTISPIIRVNDNFSFMI